MKKIFLFIFCFLFFSFLIFFIKGAFFGGNDNYLNNYIEENFIEPTINPDISIEDISDEIVLDSAYKISFEYFPETLIKTSIGYTNILKIFFNSSIVKDKINGLKVELYEKKGEVRGKMKYHRIKLFGIKKMGLSEFTSVGIHEFAHFIDLYFLEKKVIKDVSNYFYNISWYSTKVLKPGSIQDDFVSGYAMTNKYEDFAESFTYFLLHNGDFLEKSKKSEKLKEKYDFFSKYLFRDTELPKTDFSEGNKVKNYYRDITKIEFSLKKLLIFLKK